MNIVVFALPRGGVPVAAEVAVRLGAPLHLFPVRKLGVPGQPELAMGAIAPGGLRVLNSDLIRELGIDPPTIERVTAAEQVELERRQLSYQGTLPPPAVAGRTVVLVDDGLATGSTMEAAVLALRQLEPSRIVVAAPVGASDTCERLRAVADMVVCLVAPTRFGSVGAWYENFEQTTDDEVKALIHRIRSY